MGSCRFVNFDWNSPAIIRTHVRLKRLSIAVIALCVLLNACGSVIEIPLDQPLLPLSGPSAQIGEPGPTLFFVRSRQLTGEYGCTVSYETYQPDPSETEVMVVLAHGFMRELESMRGWAAHWASYGVPVTVMSLCNSSWLNGHHDRNAADLVALARALHDGPVLYAGFSAGGLAAYLAAAADPRTLAYLGLDSVESGGLAVSTVGRSSYPALFLLAQSSSCNAYNNMLDAVSATQHDTALRVRHATHCHFENPYDARCGWVCGSVKPPEASQVLIDTVRVLATAWVLKQTLEHPLASIVLAAAKANSGPWQGRLDLLH